jgi:iron complex transport system substrate-binding protein
MRRGALRGIAAGALTAALALPVQAAPARPAHIMSLTLCADLLLLQLVPRERIASVTYLAHDGAEALFPGADRGVAVNHGTAEDIIVQRPDLILSDSFSSPITRRLARRIGAPLVVVDDARTFADIRKEVRLVGAAVGEPSRAEALVAGIDADLARLAAMPARAPRRVVAWGGGDSVPGRDTLSNHILEAAGAVNVAARPGLGYTSFDVEQLLMADPEAVLFGGGGPPRPALRDDAGQHRAIRQRYAGRRIVFNGAAHTCGLPQSARSALDLRRALDRLPQRAGSR